MVSLDSKYYVQLLDFHDMALQLRQDMSKPHVKPETFTVALCQLVADYQELKEVIISPEHRVMLPTCADVIRFTDDHLKFLMRQGPVSVDTIKRLRAFHQIMDQREQGVDWEAAAWDINNPVP